MPNLASEKDVLSFCEQQRDNMEASWRKRGQFEANGYSFCGFVIATCMPSQGDNPLDPASWRPGTPLDKPRAMLCQLPPLLRRMRPGERHTAEFGKLLRHYARACAAIGTIVCGEAWCMRFEGVNGVPLSEEEVTQRRAALPKVLGVAPGRIETLFVSLEHQAAGRRYWSAEIQRSPSRLLPWQDQGLDYVAGKGNLVGITEIEPPASKAAG